MKAIRFYRYGGPDVLCWEDVPDPRPKRGEIRVQVHAAALNPKDILVRTGKMRLFTGGARPRKGRPEAPRCLSSPRPSTPEHTRGVIEELAVGRTIAKVRVTADEIVFDGLGRAAVAARLRGRRIEGAHRRGKYIWLTLDRGPHPIIHLGMTGSIRHLRDEPLKLSSSPQDV